MQQSSLYTGLQWNHPLGHHDHKTHSFAVHHCTCCQLFVDNPCIYHTLWVHTDPHKYRHLNSSGPTLSDPMSLGYICLLQQHCTCSHPICHSTVSTQATTMSTLLTCLSGTHYRPKLICHQENNKTAKCHTHISS